jgi:CheY-like chemotaxis protein
MNASALILIVEQQASQLLLVDQTFRKQGVLNRIHVLRSSREAKSYLDGVGIYQNRKLHPLPGMIIIDLNLPEESGFELIEWIRGEPQLKRLLIAATDGEATDARSHRAYNAGANAVYRKPLDYQELAELIQEVELMDDVRDAKRKIDEEQNGNI